MSETVLNALMQLFAMLAHNAKVSSKGKATVADFLRSHTSGNALDEYMQLYLRYFTFFQNELPDTPQADTTDSTINEPLLPYMQRACNRIRKGLTLTDRLTVYIMMLEFIKLGEKCGDSIINLLNITVESFGLDKDEAESLYIFIIENNTEQIPSGRIVRVESQLDSNIEEFEGRWVEENKPNWLKTEHTIYNQTIRGRLLLLHIATAEFFVMQYFGEGELYLNSRIIAAERTYVLQVGDIISGQSVDPIYYSTLQEAVKSTERQQKVVLAANDLYFHFPSSNNGIQSFSFSEESGNLVAILGGSGAGKSTLLNLLTGKYSPTGGNVSINGYSIHNDRRSLEGVIGYVPQDDLLFEDLTVYQNLFYNAKLCFSNFSEVRIRLTVERVLNDLGLSEARNLKVGSPTNKVISGGQRKRLNIGLELLRQPAILFVDEPTSGLSSADSLMVMKLLKEQANNGRLVVTTIHQPSTKIFRLIDSLWVLDKGGYPVYTGNPIEALSYFKSQSGWANPLQGGCPQCGTINPDLILEIIEMKEVDQKGFPTQNRLREPQEWYQLYKKRNQVTYSPKQHKNTLPRNLFNIPNVEVQLKIFLQRNILSKLANHQYILINLLEAPILAFILSYFTKYIHSTEYTLADNINLPAYLFMSVLVALFMGLTVSAEEIINDRKILEREAFLNLSRFSYHTSKLVFLFTLSAIQMLLFVLVGNTILAIEGMTLSHWLILFSTACFANMVGLNLSAGLNSVIAIYICIPFILVPQILLSGTVVKFDNLHPSISRRVYVPIVGDLMVSRWAFEAMAVEQFKNNKFHKHFFDLEQKVSSTSYTSNFLIPRLQSLTEECQRVYTGEQTSGKRLARNLSIIRNELFALHRKDAVPPFEYYGMLHPEQYQDEVADELFGYLIYQRMLYSTRGNEARQELDSAYSSLTDSIGAERLEELRLRNHNRAIAEWALNTHQIVKYLETDQRIISKYEPVYTIPEHNWGRAQMYAPVKRFNGQPVDTLWFNLAVIWMASLMLLVTLQTDLLRKLVNLKIPTWAMKTTQDK